jgi:porphobilinogen synthase
MDPRNKSESIIEAELDEIEGADVLMVKPALSYLDVIQTIKKNSNLPVSAYNVSGEYAMVHAAAEKGWLDYNQTFIEVLTSIKRAGADIILTYFAKDFAKFKK